ncbi:MAG: tellurite resistance TerB family protein [Pseudomonadota bacterium]
MVGLNKLLGHLMNAGGDMVGQGSKMLNTPGKKLLAGGVGAGLLFTETGRDIAKIGGVAALGAIAYKAWQSHQASKEGSAPPPQQSLEAPPADSGFVPSTENEREALAQLLITAMVTAAKADGHIDEEEQQAMIAQGESMGLTPAEQGQLFAEMGKPFDMEPVVAGASTPEIATEVYAVSVVAVGTPSPAETAYLKMLASRLNLPGDVVQSLHQSLAAPA